MLNFLENIGNQKFAYIAIGKFKSGKFAEAQKIYEEAVAAHEKIGFNKAYLFQKPGTDEAIAILIWEKKEDLQTEQAEAYAKLINIINPLYARSPIVSFYQVSSEITSERTRSEIEIDREK